MHAKFEQKSKQEVCIQQTVNVCATAVDFLVFLFAQIEFFFIRIRETINENIRPRT